MHGQQAMLSELAGGLTATVRGPRHDDALVPVFEDGRVLRTYSLNEVRHNAMRSLHDEVRPCQPRRRSTCSEPPAHF